MMKLKPFRWVIRSDAWINIPRWLRSTYRGEDYSAYRRFYLGFRLKAKPKSESESQPKSESESQHNPHYGSRSCKSKPNLHVIRGGSWSYEAQRCQSACRDVFNPGDRYPLIGFRLKAQPPPPVKGNNYEYPNRQNRSVH